MSVVKDRAARIFEKALNDARQLSEVVNGTKSYADFSYQVICRHKDDEGFLLDGWIDFLQNNEDNVHVSGSNSLLYALIDFDNLITPWAEETATGEEWEWMEAKHIELVSKIELIK